MKTLLLVCAAALLGIGTYQYTKAGETPAKADTPTIECATCTGADGCNACKNCKSCGHCKAGGKCGVCK